MEIRLPRGRSNWVRAFAVIDEWPTPGSAANGTPIANGTPVATTHDERLLLVKDVLTALQDLALHHRRQFDIPFIAITGSNGKTTTKEVIHAVLSSEYITYTTHGNLNNHIVCSPSRSCPCAKTPNSP